MSATGRKGASVSPVDREADRIADLMRRLAALERVGHVHQSGGVVNVPPGTVVFSVATSPDPGWAMFDGSTIVNGQTLYPELWSRIPAAMKVGANIVLPAAPGRTFVVAGSGAGLTTRALLATGGAETVALTAAQTAVKGHGHTFTGSAATSGAGSSHGHTFTGNAVASGNVSSDHTHSMQSHTHSATTGTVSADHSHGYSGNTGGFSNNHTHGGWDNNNFVSWAGVSSSNITTGGGGYANSPTTNWSNHDHTHGFSGNTGGISANHTHGVTTGGPSSASTGGISANHTHTTTSTGTNSNEAAHTHSVTATGTVSTLADGAAGSAHENMPPFLALNAFIKLD